MCKHITSLRAKLHLGFKSLFCKLTRCFDSPLDWCCHEMVLTYFPLLSYLEPHPKQGFIILERCQKMSRCIFVFFILSFQMRFNCQNDRRFELGKGPSEMSELHCRAYFNWHISKHSFMLGLTLTNHYISGEKSHKHQSEICAT